MPVPFDFAVDGSPAPSYPKIVRAFPDSWVMTKRNLRTMVRMPENFVFRLIQPLIFLLVFYYIAGGAIKIPGAGTGTAGYREFLIPGILAQTVTFAAASASVGIADDMTKGMVDRFRTLPMSRSAVLTGRALADLLQTAVTLLALAGVSLAIGWRVHSGILSVIYALLLLLLVSFSLSWVGALIGLSVRTPEAASSGGLIWVFPVAFVSDAFVPVQTMPGWLQGIAYWNPFSAIVQACRTLLGAPGINRSGPWPIHHPIAAALFWSVVILTIFAPLAIRKYQKIGR